MSHVYLYEEPLALYVILIGDKSIVSINGKLAYSLEAKPARNYWKTCLNISRLMQSSTDGLMKTIIQTINNEQIYFIDAPFSLPCYFIAFDVGFFINDRRLAKP